MESISPAHPAVGSPAGSPTEGSVSPHQPVPPKNVAFELLFDSPQHRARLPMRVGIYPHDDTDSIVTTVKNFYGLYSGPTGSMGVSFEDENHNTMIARYENFKNGMTVYVRVHEESPSASPGLGAPFPQTTLGPDESGNDPQTFGGPLFERRSHDISRPNSRASRKRSLSPGAASNRTAGSMGGKKSRSRSSKSRPYRDADAYSDSMNGYSSGDNAPSTTSGRNKDQFGNTDISVDNIVEGGRRKRAKFESSVSLSANCGNRPALHLFSPFTNAINNRSFLYLLHLRCRLLLPTHLYLLLVVSNITGHLCRWGNKP